MSVPLPIYRNEIPNQVPTGIKNSANFPRWAVDRAPQTVEELDQMCATPEGRKMFLMQHNQLFYAWAMGGITAAPGSANDYKGKKYHYLFQAMSEIDPIELVRKATIVGQVGTNLSAAGNKVMGFTRYISRPGTPAPGPAPVQPQAGPAPARSWFSSFFSGGRRTKRRMMKKRKTRKMGKKGKK
jgi:hypothetical protein